MDLKNNEETESRIVPNEPKIIPTYKWMKADPTQMSFTDFFAAASESEEEDEPEPPKPPLHTGDLVCLKGVRKDYDGLDAHVVAYLHEKERYRVRMVLDNREFNVKRENLWLKETGVKVINVRTLLRDAFERHSDFEAPWSCVEQILSFAIAFELGVYRECCYSGHVQTRAVRFDSENSINGTFQYKVRDLAYTKMWIVYSGKWKINSERSSEDYIVLNAVADSREKVKYSKKWGKPSVRTCLEKKKADKRWIFRKIPKDREEQMGGGEQMKYPNYRKPVLQLGKVDFYYAKDAAALQPAYNF